MPTKSYGNKDLNILDRLSPISGKSYRQGLAEDGVDDQDPNAPLLTHVPSPDPFDGRAETERLLSEARGTLSHADQMARENSTSNLANLESRLASLSQGPRPSLSNAAASVTEPFADVGHSLQLASVPAAFGGPVPAGMLMTAGTALAAPDILRRLAFPRQAADPTIMASGGEPHQTIDVSGPVQDELRTDAALEGALTFAPNAIGAARKLMAKPPLPTFGPPKLGLARELPYQNTTPAVDPNQVINLAHEIAAETGVPVETVLKGYGRSGGVAREQSNALQRLLGSGPKREPVAAIDELGATDTFAPFMEKPPVDPLEAFASGPRIERGMGNSASVTPQSLNYEPGNFDELARGMRERTGGSDALRRLLMERNQTGPHTLAPAGRLRGGQ